MHTGVAQIPVCIQGSIFRQSPYACGDQGDSLYAYGDLRHPHVHTGIDETIITICIRGISNLCTDTGDDLDPRMHMGIMCISIPICKLF